jgi:hypothetical protein
MSLIVLNLASFESHIFCGLNLSSLIFWGIQVFYHLLLLHLKDLCFRLHWGLHLGYYMIIFIK